jgi:general stress protein CsbA
MFYLILALIVVLIAASALRGRDKFYTGDE